MSKLEMSRKVHMGAKTKMKHVKLMCCQNCNAQYDTIKLFKAHIRNYGHKQEVSRLFQTALYKGQVFFPIFGVLDYVRSALSGDPVIGLDMVTLCITPERVGAFYLCHVCEESLKNHDVLKHLCSVDHYYKYLAHRNPELLRFAWFTNSFSYLQCSAKKEHLTNGAGTLRVLELPKVMLETGKEMAYHQVMNMFSKTKKVIELVRANRPQRKTIQAYITDPARTNPLLGLNFLLEFSCPDSEWHCGYLCTLCRQKVSAIDCISHCISFDHIYWYMEAAHPATLQCPKSSYTNYSFSFNQKILYFANQAQKHHPPGIVESVRLDLSAFKEVDSSSYANALNKLQQLRREKNQKEFQASVVPGTQICSPAQTGSSCPLILCVECNQKFSLISDYERHINESQHKQKLAELFEPAQYSGFVTEIKLYQYLWSRHRKNLSSPPLIGLQLFTVLVDRSQYSSTEIYLCHACEINISTSASSHLTSMQHYFNVFAHSKPDLVFLGSQNLNQITELAQEEELKQGKPILQVCEVPNHLCRIFKNLSYERIMATIEEQYSEMSKCAGVQKRVTLQSYVKSPDRKSPLVGLQCLVKYSTTQPVPKYGYLCLLCERKLSEMLVINHMLSYSHIVAYLNVAHPGSLRKDDQDMSLIVDLARQAEAVSAGASMQEVDLDFGTLNERDTFKAALHALQLVVKKKGLKELKLSIVPGSRLVSSLKKPCQNNSLKCVAQESSPTSLNMRQINTEASCSQTFTPITGTKAPGLISENIEPLKTTCGSASTNIQRAEPLVVSTSSQLPVVSLNTQQSGLLEMNTEPVSPAMPPYHNPVEAKEFCSMSKPLQTQNVSLSQPQSPLAQNSREPEETLQKQTQSSTCSKNKAQVVPQSPASSNVLWNYLQTTVREPVIGLSSVVECHTDGKPPYYLCISCTERVKEDSIIEHLTNREHQKMYLSSIKYTPLLAKKKLKTKWLKFSAVMLEKRDGYGEAQILELNAEDYNQILYAPIITALTKLRDLLQEMTSDISDQNTMAAFSSVGSKCDERLQGTIKNTMRATENDKPCDPLRETVVKEDSKSDTIIKHDSDDPVRSSPHLWSYLTSPARTEPVIGLNMVTEFRSFSGQNSFLCSCCNSMLSTRSYVGHLIGPRHRFNYMKDKHPHLVEKWTDQVSLTSKISELKEKAQIVQDLEGWGHFKVVEKDSPKQKEQTATIADSATAQEPEPLQTSRDTGAENLTKAEEPEPSQSSSETVCTEPPQQDQNQQRQKSTTQTKNAKKMIKKKRTYLIGLNFITCVSHEKKKLFFCELCSVRCSVDHMSSVAHRKAYVQHKYPGWTANDAVLEKKLNEIAVHLAAVEKSTGIGMKKLHVPAEVFTALRIAPVSEALSQLKLQQTKQTQPDLRASLAPPEPSCNTESEETSNNVEDPTLCSAAANNSVQQEQTPVPEMSAITDESSSTLSGSHSCSVSSVPVSSLLTISNVHTFDKHEDISCDPSSTDIHTSAEICTTHSLKTSVTESITATSIPLPTLPPFVPDLPPLPFSSVHQSLPVPDLSPDSQIGTTSQCLSLASDLYEPISPAPVNRPLSPAPVYEPVSPPTLNEHVSSHASSASSQPSPYVAPLYSPSSPTPSDNSSKSMTLPQPFNSHLTGGEDHTDDAGLSREIRPRPQPSNVESKVITQSIYNEESRSTRTYSFLNFPTVMGQSHAYAFLSLRNLLGTEPIIGLGHIVECRTMSRPTFFLCLNCAKKIRREDFCSHMTSEPHWHFSIRVQYPEEFQEWQAHYHTLAIRDLAGRIALREQNSDAKVIKLDQKQYERMQSADFFSAFEMLLNMYGPDQSQNSLPLHFERQNQREISSAHLLQVSVDTDRETPRHQSPVSCDLNPSQAKHGLPTSPVPDSAFDGAKDNPDRSTEISSLTCNQSQLSQSPEKTCMNSKTEAQAEAPAQLIQHQFKTGLTAESPKDSGNNTDTTPETPDALSTNLGLQQKTTNSLPCTIRIKQEKPNNDNDFQEKCCPRVNTSPSLDAPASTEVTGNLFKHKPDLISSLNSKRDSKSVADAVVGLSSIIECRSDDQSSLFLCIACSSKLNRDLIINHLMKPGHRESYLRQRYPFFFEDWPECDTRTRSVMLMRLAHQVEKTYEDEPGQLQEMELQCADLKEIKDLSFDKALTQLQKIRKAQNLCALQTCISPRKQPVLVKQEDIETEVKPQHIPPLDNSLGKTAQTSRGVSKRRIVEDSSHKPHAVAKQIKLQTRDNQMPSSPSPQNAKIRAQKSTITVFPKSLPQVHDKTKQSPSRVHEIVKKHASCSSSAASATRHNDKPHSCPTQKPTISNMPSKKSVEQTKSLDKTKLESSTKTQKAHRSAAPKPEQSVSNDSQTRSKQHRSETKAVSSLSKKKRIFTDYPPTPVEQATSVLSSPVPSEPPIKRRSLDERLADFTHLQNTATALLEGTQTLLPNTLRDTDPCSPTERVPSKQPLNQTVSHLYPYNSAVSAPALQAQGQEIARLHETPSVIFRSSENAWNYENRQFSTNSVDTNQVAASTVGPDQTIRADGSVNSAYACADSNSIMSYTILAQNANSYFSMTSGCAETIPTTSPVLPGYAVPYQYLGYTQPAYATQSTGTTAHDYTLAANGTAMNAGAAAPSHSPTLGYHVPNDNSAYTSQQVHPFQQVYQPVQSYQSPDAYAALCSFYAYNQALQPSQATTFTGSATSADSAYGHVPKN
ncbi:uncharacterized protein LOC103038962 isoform X1 [Astyanax mexicanus]|uniref:uncharacterized protein LOC103038962 isoform X1 n=1 Tax=Astyanax mexicanus TaxID=7994 RepID=UPI0020CB5D33|nr:uncharacterized protein LOC103038962 isoform X1 [Astyanax mexicanus]